MNETTLSLREKKIHQKIVEISHSLPFSQVFGLYTGEAGKALFQAYLNLFFGKEKYLNDAEISLFNIFNEITNVEMSSSFCGGTAGLLWMIDHLKEKEIIYFEEDLGVFPNQLATLALKYAGEGDFDFMHGSGGIIFYLLDRNILTEETMTKWLSLLKGHANRSNSFYSWKTVVNKETGAEAYNLCLSHGISSIIIILAEILKKFPNNAVAKELLEGSIGYLLSWKKENGISLFPSYINGRDDKLDSRLAWCYGDLGNAIALWRAGNLIQEENLKKEALSIMIHASQRRDLTENQLIDAGFCHGTCGVAHIFNRFYKETRIELLNEARWFWLEKTLEYAKWPDGIAGYKAFSGKSGYYNQYNLLEGVCGIGIVMLGFLKDDNQCISWDRCFLMS